MHFSFLFKTRFEPCLAFGVLALAPAGPGPPPASCDSRPQVQPETVSSCARTRRALGGGCDAAADATPLRDEHARHVNHADNSRWRELSKGRPAAMLRWLQWTCMSRHPALGLSVLVFEYWYKGNDVRITRVILTTDTQLSYSTAWYTTA